MKYPGNARALWLAAGLSTLAGCSTVQPAHYAGIDSTSYLTPTTTDDAVHLPFSYSTQVDWRAYKRVIVDPVRIYPGPDNQFGDMSMKDRTALATYMQITFGERLGKKFQVVSQPQAQTLRIKLTLTGADTSTPILSTLSRFDIAGGLYNSVQAVRGREGAFTGSVIYAVEIYDAGSNRLLSAFVAKQYPNAWNLGSTFGSLSASKVGIDKGADALVAQLD